VPIFSDEFGEMNEKKGLTRENDTKKEGVTKHVTPSFIFKYNVFRSDL